MPTREWLRRAFAGGYDSGNILAAAPDTVRAGEERAIGGSYAEFWECAVVPHLAPECRVLELGPGRGSWTRAILSVVTHGVVETVDVVDVTPWLAPAQYGGRLRCHTVRDNSFDCVADGSFDVFFSFGVLCHNNIEHIAEILANSRAKMNAGGVAIHQYGDWAKLDTQGWTACGMPEDFKGRSDDEI